MKQTTIRLQEPEFQTAVHLARAKGVPLAEYVRQAVIEKNTGEKVLAHINEAREELREMLDAMRSEVGRLHNDLSISQRLANEALAQDLEKKFGEEVDDQREMLANMFKQFASYVEGNEVFGMPPMKTPSSHW